MGFTGVGFGSTPVEAVAHPPVQDCAGLSALTSYQDQMVCLAEDLGLYRFDAQSTDVHDCLGVIIPDDITHPAPGRWIRLTNATAGGVAAHGSTHTGNSTDPIPVATGIESGLMSAADKSTFDTHLPGSSVVRVQDLQDMGGTSRFYFTIGSDTYSYQSILPITDLAYSLGSASYRWNEVRAQFFYGDGSGLTNLPSGSPAGANTEIQFNNAGAFGASSSLTWNGNILSTDAFVATGTSANFPLSVQSSGTNKVLFGYTSSAARFASDWQVTWDSSATAGGGAVDVGIARDSAGVLRVSNGFGGSGNLLASTFKASSLTANRILVSGTAGLIANAAALTNGQLLIGSTAAAPVAANLTAGTGISIVNGAGSISITASAGNFGADPAFVDTNGNNVTTDATASSATTTLTTTSTTYIQGATLSTGALTGTYWVFWSAEISNTSAASTAAARLQNITDSLTLGEAILNVPASANFNLVGGVAELVLSGVSKTLNIQYKRIGGVGTISLRRARIMFVRKA